MLLGHTLRSRDRGGVRCVAHTLDPLTRADPTSAENARFEKHFAENARAASPGGRPTLTLALTLTLARTLTLTLTRTRTRTLTLTLA